MEKVTEKASIRTRIPTDQRAVGPVIPEPFLNLFLNVLIQHYGHDKHEDVLSLVFLSRKNDTSLVGC